MKKITARLILGFTLFVFSIGPNVFAAEKVKTVVVFFSLDVNLPAYKGFLDGLNEQFSKNPDQSYNLIVEYIDLNRFSEEDEIKNIIGLYKEKYKAVDIDILITFGPGTYPLLNKYDFQAISTSPTINIDLENNIAKAFQGDRAAFEQAENLINVCFDVGFKAFAVSLAPFIGEQYLLIGEYESALSWLEKILDHVNKTGSHMHTAELFRIKGLTLFALGEPDNVVEENFTQAIELSIKQSAKTFELRAAGDLASLWKKQGKTNEAYDLLKGVYDWFTEGFDTVDLKEARIKLAQIKMPI